jgi:hypothetical protein
MEAALETKELVQRLALQRINFKSMWDDITAMWKKLVTPTVKGGAAKERASKRPTFEYIARYKLLYIQYSHK